MGRTYDFAPSPLYIKLPKNYCGYMRYKNTPYFIHKIRTSNTDKWIITLRVLTILDPKNSKPLLYKIWRSSGKFDYSMTKEQVQEILKKYACPSHALEAVTYMMYDALSRGLYRIGIDTSKFVQKEILCPLCDGTGKTTILTNEIK